MTGSEKNINTVRLNKFLARCGVGSRRTCDDYIFSGLVSVNGQKILTPSYMVDDNSDVVRFKNRIVKPEKKKIYIFLNKPTGFVTTVHDEKSRKTVMDLVPSDFRLFPVGRLDLNTSGGILLTNDGDLAHLLMHPSSEVKKKYQVQLDKSITQSDLVKLRSGVLLDKKLTARADVAKIDPRTDSNWIEITIHEGRNRQIRRMLEVIGYGVKQLIRVQFANLKIDTLRSGHWRYLTNKEVKILKQLANA